MKDQRIVYGATCAWWDSIDKVGSNGEGPLGGLPCCPHCKGVLFEMPGESEWWRGVDQHERNGTPGYRAFVEWLRGKCFPGGYKEALTTYDAERKP